MMLTLFTAGSEAVFAAISAILASNPTGRCPGRQQEQRRADEQQNCAPLPRPCQYGSAFIVIFLAQAGTVSSVLSAVSIQSRLAYDEGPCPG